MVSGPALPTGPVGREVTLTAVEQQIDLAGRTATVWTYGDFPARAIRTTVGERVRITVNNRLPEQTSVHWHGLAVPNAMDGVPDVTTPSIVPDGSFTYDFVVPTAGTHWLHPHTGLQLDTGLYAPFIVEDPSEPGDYEHEFVLVLDDWTQGFGRDPEQIFEQLVAGGEQTGMMMGHGHMGMAGGDVEYPLYLINGRPPADPQSLRVAPGDRVRLRIINAGADTLFRVTVAGHEMTVTHTDGFGVQPTAVPGLLIGMGERYDVTVTAGSGVFPIVAEPVGKAGYALALLRTVDGPAPAAQRPDPIDSSVALRVRADAALPPRAPDVTHDLVLSGSMTPYRWTINGATYDRAEPLRVNPGDMVRLRLANMSMMSHPVHLHGHTFQIGEAGGSGARKDTVLLAPMSRVTVDVVADNPGVWMLHCHNAYHAEAGMMTRLEYTT